ncbi:MAG TPA: histidine kinase dimerization/phosphoacceptor domain -containing protein [Spirochaetota bacterium]|nr:histidine kinase dimerization/phosphoacceptor domain -containing protein [Spirochaetota bacterium]
MKRARIPLILMLLVSSTLLIWYFRVVNRHEIIFTHLFYIPIVLSAFWWYYRSGFVVLYLSAALITSDLYAGDTVMILHDAVRGIIFLAVGYTVAFLRREKLRLFNLIRYRQIISSMREPVAILNGGGDIILRNEKFSGLFHDNGHDINFFRGLMSDEDFSCFRDSLARCFEKGETTFTSYIKIPGSPAGFFSVNLSPVAQDDNSADAVLTLWDITEQKKTEENLKTALDRQKLVIDVLNLLNNQKAGSDGIKSILDLVKHRTAVEALGIILHREGEFRLHAITGIDETLREKIESECSLINHQHVEPGTLCLCCRALDVYNSSEAATADDAALFWSNDIERLAGSDGLSMCGCIKEGGFKSTAVIPFSGDEGLLGFFVLFDSAGNFFNEELIDYYRGVVQSIGIALNRAEYEASLKKTIIEKEHLIREVHHRVKNNMQVITSLISLQASRQTDEDIRSVLNDCQNRVRAMALVQERLYNSSDFSSINFQNYIQTLVTMLMSSFRIDRQRIRVSLDVSDINIGINTAIPLAQLINEILSNSFKHAFAGRDNGIVNVSLHRSEENKNCTLEISDNGNGLRGDVVFPQGGNLGFQLIDALIKQLRGKYTFNCRTGVSFIILFNE